MGFLTRTKEAWTRGARYFDAKRLGTLNKDPHLTFVTLGRAENGEKVETTGTGSLSHQDEKKWEIKKLKSGRAHS